MSTNNDATAQLKKEIADGTEHTKTYLDSLKESIANFDNEHKLTDTATSYLQAGIDQAHRSVNELRSFGAKMQDESKDVSQEVVDAAKSAFSSMQSSLEGLKAKAVEYDSKVKQNVAEGAETTKSSMEELFNTAKNQGASFYDGIAASLDNMQKQLSATASNAHTAITSTASSAADSVANAATAAKDKAVEADENVTGGASADLYNKTAELVNKSVEYMSDAVSGLTEDEPTIRTKP